MGTLCPIDITTSIFHVILILKIYVETTKRSVAYTQ